VENVVKYDSEEELKNDTKMTGKNLQWYCMYANASVLNFGFLQRNKKPFIHCFGRRKVS
jgi:hypothetical protein